MACIEVRPPSPSAEAFRSTRAGQLYSGGGSTRSGCLTRGIIDWCAGACAAGGGPAKNGSSYASSYSASSRSNTSGGGEGARFSFDIQRAGVRARCVSEALAFAVDDDMSRLIVSIGATAGSWTSDPLTKSDMLLGPFSCCWRN